MEKFNEKPDGWIEDPQLAHDVAEMSDPYRERAAISRAKGNHTESSRLEKLADTYEKNFLVEKEVREQTQGKSFDEILDLMSELDEKYKGEDYDQREYREKIYLQMVMSKLQERSPKLHSILLSRMQKY